MLKAIRQTYEHGSKKLSIRYYYNEKDKLVGKPEVVPYGTPRQPEEVIIPRVGVNEEYFEYIWNNSSVKRQREELEATL